jgi:hypothetical protein
MRGVEQKWDERERTRYDMSHVPLKICTAGGGE